ncbi:MAG: hypothetical protein Tsb009_37290 [Planctomycetaceae bacterium]
MVDNSRISKILKIVRSPLGIAWSAASISAFALVALMLSRSPSNSHSSALPAPSPSPVKSSRTPLPTKKVQEPELPVVAQKPLHPFPPQHHQKSPPVVSPSLKPEIVGNPVAASKPVSRKYGKGPMRVDVAAALKQPILRFQQAKPATFRDLLEEIEEMAGVPIRYNEQSVAITSKWDTRIQLKLEMVTVRDVLESIVAEVGLSYKIEKDGLRLIPEQETPGASQ